MINSVLSSLPIFMMSFFEIPTGVLQKLDAIRSRFFWQGGHHKKKYRLAKWEIICQPKEIGGLGVANLDIKNICLLSKWLFKLLNGDGVWQQLLRNKYLRDKSLTQAVRKPGDSHFWAGLMNVKDKFLKWGYFKVGNGQATRFWKDKWLNNSPLSEQFPNLFNIVRNKTSLVAEVLSRENLNLSFRRSIVGIKLVEWQTMIHLLATVNLTPVRDTFVWTAHRNGAFSTRSMYYNLISIPNYNRGCLLWKLKLPLKIKIFLWYLGRGLILTKDNLAKRRWRGSPKCSFCNQNENIQHLFFDCYIAKTVWRIIYFTLKIDPPVNINHIMGDWESNKGCMHKKLLLSGVAALFWSIWLCRNDVVFNHNHIPSIIQVIFRGTHWFRFWRLLQKEETQQQIHVVCQSLEVVAMEVFASHGWRSNSRIDAV